MIDKSKSGELHSLSAVPDLDRLVTPAEYLTFERASDTKHEYIDGQVYAMSGASRAHSLIAGSVSHALYPQLRAAGCNIFSGDMRVQVAAAGWYTYPDLVIACQDQHFGDAEVDTLLNPIVLIEILSPSTEKYDRGEKFARYQQLASLQEYLMIAQDQRQIEHYVRQPDQQWRLSAFTQADQMVELASVSSRLLVAQAYELITFDASA